ncbi:YicC/YloC family endoribonuclease [Acetivibrio mesophilus]|uniref:YicC family protein n=1 Tax=Acetivibrio mesophilus TaxID=2487273 RepID=A0A4Q0I0X8_9FIRM|nr:YicC/YloC family endoribonuclease [Acetivibrio mesophilus]ODM24892.1 YicC family protein [Clostridium sp. Bc-iso-3]RXE57880.1 YicC family protein [Acetivibrio mesophilus]HHV30071.1 YicC family protein [Clostridium sp.]
MIRSMTGFGRGKSQADGREFLVEIKTVNHRYCDIYIKLPRQISFLEEKVREVVGKSVSRGKVDVFISYDDFSEESKNILIDEGLARTYIKSVEHLRDKYGLKDDISVSLIAKFPDILKVEKSEQDEDKIWGLLSEALSHALDALINMRQVEGEGLRNDLLERADVIEKVVQEISIRAPEVVKEYKCKLENRIKEILEQQVIDENRMAMEVAIFADRCNIDEELVRLGSHINQLRQTLNNTQSDQPVGRKLDFLLQEMNREINTIGSKANDLSITQNVVEIKSELEKIREQIQNIE